MKRILFCLSLLCALWALPACSVLNPGPPLKQLALSPVLPDMSDGPRLNAQISVVQIESYSSLASTRIAVVNNRQIQYLPEVQWPSPAPQMVQNMLVRGLSDTRRLNGVGSDLTITLTDYQVFSFLNAFDVFVEAREEADARDEAVRATVRVGLDLKLVARSGRVVDYVSIKTASPAASMQVNDLLDAFERATGDALGQSVRWTLATLEKTETERKKNGPTR